MIPKIIHTVWLSGDHYPGLVRRCIRSWRRVLPDYELKVWTMHNFDIQSVQYVREAVSVRKWAPAADYIRLWALWNYGGLYLDSDVFLRRGFESLLDERFVTAIETSPGKPKVDIQAAVLASEPHHPFVRRCMAYFEKEPFILPDGSFANQKLIAPEIFAQIASADFGLRNCDEEQRIGGEAPMHVLPSRRIPSSLLHIPSDALAVHCCNGNWNTWVKRSFRSKMYRKAFPLLLARLDWCDRLSPKRNNG